MMQDEVRRYINQNRNHMSLENCQRKYIGFNTSISNLAIHKEICLKYIEVCDHKLRSMKNV